MTDADLATNLRDLLGSKMVAYLGGVQETRAVREWADEERQIASSVARERIRLALHAAMLITQRDTPGVAQAWFQGLNPALGDRSPLRVLEDADDLDTEGAAVLSAAREFSADTTEVGSVD